MIVETRYEHISLSQGNVPLITGTKMKVIELVIENGGIEYSELKMNEYKDKALEAIADINDSKAKKSLISLLEYSISRKK